ncbi:General aromatic amino acid permease [Nocardia cyriacigeorgica]|uniref:General aromatic amino acid permease n=1 Tax=Nocardia cyriacigeorgica TaxID=135487 RepID=A0A4U8WI86_9NOCA|nr:General aromatic amino acid permease [Nocardia cyriacigeorgica]
MAIASGMFRTKSVEQSIRDTDEPDSKLRKDLTAKDLTIFGVAVVIGAGIFTLTARTAGMVAGPSVSLAFVFAAIACGLTALCYAEFASTVPVAGSAYTYAYATFGEVIAWIIGWDLILEFALAVSVVAKGWSQYLGEVLGSNAPIVQIGSVDFDWGAVVIIAIVGVLLATGTKLSSRVSAIAVAIKLGVIALVLVVGATYFKPSNLTPYVPPSEPSEKAEGVRQSLFALLTGSGGTSYGWYGLLAAASLVFFAFIGFDVVATTAEETRNPQRDVPRGIFGSLAIVTVLYVAVSLVLTGMVSYTQLADGNATLATAFALNGATWVKNIIAVGALAGLSTVVMVMYLGQTRVLFAMSRDGLLPRGLAQTGSKGTPVRLTVIVGVVCAAGRVRRLRHPRRDGQYRHPGRLRAGVGGRAGPAAHPSGSAARLPGAVRAGPADPGRAGLPVADAESVHRDLASVRDLDGPRHGRLLRLQPLPLDAAASVRGRGENPDSGAVTAAAGPRFAREPGADTWADLPV